MDYWGGGAKGYAYVLISQSKFSVPKKFTLEYHYCGYVQKSETYRKIWNVSKIKCFNVRIGSTIVGFVNSADDPHYFISQYDIVKHLF